MKTVKTIILLVIIHLTLLPLLQEEVGMELGTNPTGYT